MSKIGLCTYWGWARGMAYGNLGYAKMLVPEHEVFVLKLGDNDISDEFKEVDVHITEAPSFNIDDNLFIKWIKDNKLDAIIFNEYDQWGKVEYKDKDKKITTLPEIAKNLGCKVYGDLVMERFEPEQALIFDRVFAQTVSMERFFRFKKVRNFVYVPRSIDLNEFPLKPREENELFTFFHPAGYGGVANRKNTDKVLKAFTMLNRKDSKLIIASQKNIQVENVPENVEIINSDLPRKELLELYHKSDVILIPSKWETVGLPILEALASGRPVIVNDVPPMNEFIVSGKNGYLCSVDLKKYDGISILGAEVSAAELKSKMETIMNKTVHPLLCKHARKVAERLYDVNVTKKYLLDFLNKELKNE